MGIIYRKLRVQQILTAQGHCPNLALCPPTTLACAVLDIRPHESDAVLQIFDLSWYLYLYPELGILPIEYIKYILNNSV